MKEIKVFACPTAEEFAGEICDYLKIEPGKINSLKFKNDNNFVQIQETVREKDVYIVQSNVPPVNERIMEHKKNGYKSIAIIGKDIKECKEIEKQISKIREDVKLIQGKDSKYNAGISVVPSYLAKGLEFDCVIIANANNERYSNNSLDIKLLYVAITRAMSKLDIFYTNTKSKILPC